MLNLIEDARTEFKAILNDKLEKEVVSFLNADGGNIYIGVKDNGEIIGINDDLDKIQLDIKNRIKSNIEPMTLGLFDIKVESHDDKKYIHLTIAGGNARPYYIKKFGMTPKGCFKRIGSAAEPIDEKQIEKLYASRVRNSLLNMKSPKNDLKFSQLKIYYEEMGFAINDNFLELLDLVDKDGNYNYLAYLLADNNRIPICVGTFKGTDKMDLIEYEDYGNCSLVKACKMVIEKFKLINNTYANITYAEREETNKFDEKLVREAIINAFVHNEWVTENPPKFEIYSDHISIVSTGGLPYNATKEDFYKGHSKPVHPELMRIFKDLDLVENMGTGIRKILRMYGKDIFEFSDNFIVVSFKYNGNEVSTNPVAETFEPNETQKYILKLIGENSTITILEIASELCIGRTTVKRNIKELMENKMITRTGSNRNGKWLIL
mgnify:CR=1 FL=1